MEIVIVWKQNLTSLYHFIGESSNWYKNYESKEENSDEYSPRQSARMNNHQGYRTSIGQRSYYVSHFL